MPVLRLPPEQSMHFTRMACNGIRRGARRGWMVWDRQTKGPTKYLGYRPWNCQKSKREKWQTN